LIKINTESGKFMSRAWSYPNPELADVC
jgi:hypothetical protein